MPKKRVLFSLESENSKTLKKTKIQFDPTDPENFENEKEFKEVEHKTPSKNKILGETVASHLNKQEMKHKADNSSPRKQKSVYQKNSQASKMEFEVLEAELPPGLIQEVNENLEQKAELTNLTARNVKNMIKAVLTDSEVLKLVDFSLEKTDEKPIYELKLTRAKTKELVGLDQNAIFNIPLQPKNPEIEALITQELPEDSSDEEYEPHLSEDEESKASEAGIFDDDGDLDSSIGNISNLDGSFRNENIGQRTRSKLSLSETPLEAIEQQFIPPDITTDMYDTDCDNEEWLNFLKGFMQPLDSEQHETNDDENDPEYNVMIDEEKEATDKEELRADRAVKVTKKELNNLISELFEYTEMLPSDDDETHPKSLGDTNTFIEQETQASNSVAPINNCMECQFSVEQCLLLKQQLQQHVQLLLQNCLLLCGLPNEYTHCFNESKARLIELSTLKSFNVNSYFNILNLESSIKLINDWANLVQDSPLSKKIKNFLIEEQNKIEKFKKTKIRYRPELPTELVKLCLKSDAFLYPILLPSAGFTEYSSPVIRFTEFEDTLIAIGLDEFSTFLKNDLETHQGFTETVSHVCHYLLTCRREDQITDHIKKAQKSKKPNPVKQFLLTKKPPVIKHFIVLHTSLKLLSQFPQEYLPEKWIKHLDPLL